MRLLAYPPPQVRDLHAEQRSWERTLGRGGFFCCFRLRGIGSSVLGFGFRVYACDRLKVRLKDGWLFKGFMYVGASRHYRQESEEDVGPIPFAIQSEIDLGSRYS